jgi:hypothetical protein
MSASPHQSRRGYKELNFDDLVELREMGFTGLPVDEIVELSIHHVTPRFIREMRRQYGENLTLAQLLEMRIRGVDEDLLEELRAAGVKIKG